MTPDKTVQEGVAPRDRLAKFRDQKHLQELLDAALDGTFPASDPIELTSLED